MYDVILTEASPSVLKQRKKVRKVICELLITYKTLSVGDISRFLSKRDKALTHVIGDTIDEMETEGLIAVIKNNPQITYIRAAIGTQTTTPKRKRMSFSFPKVEKQSPRPDHEIIHARR